MFLNEEQLKGNINTVDRQLLYDIRELIRENNQLLNKLLNGGNKDEKSPDETCKYCGKVHINKGVELACMRKRKKEATT